MIDRYDARTQPRAESRRRSGWTGLLLAASIGIAVITLTALMIGLAERSRTARAPRRSSAQPVIPSVYEDVAVSCLALGEVTPPLAEIDGQALESIVATLARMLGAYQHADFQAFLDGRRADLAFASLSRADRVEELRATVRELGVRGEDVPHDWVGALAVFWSAYYARPPLAHVVAESARLVVARDDPAEVVAWESSFDALRDAIEGQRIEHHLAVPHRRSVSEVRRVAGTLTWMEFSVRFETPDGETGRLLCRFVWDEADTDWFLHRAVTAYPQRSGNVPDRRNFIL